jgi:type II secretory pathway component PulJ
MRALAGRGGATLIEQLLALLLGAVMVASLYGFYRAQLFHLIGQQKKTATLEDARGALDILARDLKNAGSWGGGAVPAEHGGGDDPDDDADGVCNRVYAASATMIHIQMDLNGNGDCSDNDPKENVRYELTGPTATCPGTQILRRNGDCLVANVTLAVAGKLFTYFDAAGADLGPTPAPTGIKRIYIAFAVHENIAEPGDRRAVQSQLATSVQLRN